MAQSSEMSCGLPYTPTDKRNLDFSLPTHCNRNALVRQLLYEKENSEFKRVKLRLKIDLVSYAARVYFGGVPVV